MIVVINKKFYNEEDTKAVEKLLNKYEERGFVILSASPVTTPYEVRFAAVLSDSKHYKS